MMGDGRAERGEPGSSGGIGWQVGGESDIKMKPSPVARNGKGLDGPGWLGHRQAWPV